MISSLTPGEANSDVVVEVPGLENQSADLFYRYTGWSPATVAPPTWRTSAAAPAAHMAEPLTPNPSPEGEGRTVSDCSGA